MMQYETINQLLKDMRASDALVDLCRGELSHHSTSKVIQSIIPFGQI
jgi:hypothetical protein